MIGLWIAAALVSAGLAALMVQRGRAAMRRMSADNPALAVYQRQMAELDDLADRGLIGEGERRGVRTETGRRLLAAAGRAEPPLSPGRPVVILAVAAAVPLVALVAYVVLGAPSLGDQPFAHRLAEWKQISGINPGELTAPQAAAVLRANAAAHPRDPTALAFLARADLESGQAGEAVQALHRALAISPRNPELWELLAVAQMTINDEALAPDAVDAFKQELALDPTSTIARFYLAQAKIEGGDVAGGLADWKALEPAFPLGDPRRKLLEERISQVTQTGHLAPPAPPGGAQAQVGGPQIQAMVDGLAARLAAHPDDPEGWVRLVRAYTVLGETDRRDAALNDARRRYAGQANILAELEDATHASPMSQQGAGAQNSPAQNAPAP